LLRPFFVKKENIAKADRIIELFKERAFIPCDKNRNPISLPELRCIKAYKLRQAGVPYEEIAKIVGSTIKTTRNLVWYAKHSEEENRRRREIYRRKKISVI